MTNDRNKRRMATEWRRPNLLPPLEANEVQVWRIRSDQSDGIAAGSSTLLNAEEQAHSDRLRSGRVRDHFTIGRACSRILLGNIQSLDPREVIITTGAHGKPETPHLGERALFFNVAHSGETILIALCRMGSVGIDVEHIDRDTDIMEVAKANFTKEEISALEAIADTAARRRTFFHYWTRKEAVGKADGRGLLLPLASFDVSVESMTSHPVRVKGLPGEEEEEEELYFVSDLDLGDQAVAAVALHSPDCHINTMIFHPALYPAARSER